MSPLQYQILERHAGLTEAKDWQRIAEIGRLARMEEGWDPRKIPWCDIVLDGAFALAGMPYTASRLARSWHTDNPDWGDKITRIEDLRQGDVVVLATQPAPHGHAGLLDRRAGGKLHVLGGNQSNALNITPFAESLFVAGFRPTAEPSPRTAFFNCVRQAPFPGNLTQGQVDGLNLILAYFDQWSDQDLPRFAYVLATVFHETGYRFEPITEYGSQEYLRAKKYYPWIGRGYVQLTWEDNYKKMGGLIDVDLIADPEKANDPDVAVRVLFEGMYRAESGIGDFTQKSLEEYFNATTDDPEGARRIVNGTDKAGLIAGYHRDFLKALEAAKTVAEYVGTVVAPTPPEPAPEPPVVALPEPSAPPRPQVPVPVPLNPVSGGVSPDAGVDRHLPLEHVQRLNLESAIEGMAGGYFEAVYVRKSVRWVPPGGAKQIINRIQTIGEEQMSPKPGEVVRAEVVSPIRSSILQAVAGALVTIIVAKAAQYQLTLDPAAVNEFVVWALGGAISLIGGLKLFSTPNAVTTQVK